jgi:hypothetical protein
MKRSSALLLVLVIGVGFLSAQSSSAPSKKNLSKWYGIAIAKELSEVPAGKAVMGEVVTPEKLRSLGFENPRKGDRISVTLVANDKLKIELLTGSKQEITVHPVEGQPYAPWQPHRRT